MELLTIKFSFWKIQTFSMNKSYSWWWNPDRPLPIMCGRRKMLTTKMKSFSNTGGSSGMPGASVHSPRECLEVNDSQNRSVTWGWSDVGMMSISDNHSRCSQNRANRTKLRPTCGWSYSTDNFPDQGKWGKAISFQMIPLVLKQLTCSGHGIGDWKDKQEASQFSSWQRGWSFSISTVSKFHRTLADRYHSIGITWSRWLNASLLWSCYSSSAWRSAHRRT